MMIWDPLRVSLLLWGLWWVSWALAAAWTAQTRIRLPFGQEIIHLAPTIAGFGLLFSSTGVRTGGMRHMTPLYELSLPASWLVTCLCAAGFAFAWWARVHLGRLWSASVQQKDGHRLIDTGPYRYVRHPIYTGILASGLAMAAQTARPAGFLGIALMTLGFWLKARMEEALLSESLGAETYASYRARTPMLIPFTKLGGRS